MVAIAPDASLASDGLVDAPSYADHEAADTQTQTTVVAGFDDAVHVIVLDRELEDVKAVARACRQGVANCDENPFAAERSNAAGSAQGDVDGKAVNVCRSRAVRDGRAPAGNRQTTGTAACAAPARRHRELHLFPSSRHLEKGRKSARLTCTDVANHVWFGVW